MRQKNIPTDFPYGNALKAVFDKIYEGTKFAYDEGHFEPGRVFDDVGKDGLYIHSGNDVYRATDKLKVTIASEIIGASSILGVGRDFIPESLAAKLDYYSKFSSQIKDAIEQDPSAKGISISKAYLEYGKHIYSQIDCFDLRSFSNKGFSNFKD
jgi:hypothetical protein